MSKTNNLRALSAVNDTARYVRGKSFPTPKNLAALALAFGMKETDLLPNHVESAIDEDNPALHIILIS